MYIALSCTCRGEFGHQNIKRPLQQNIPEVCSWVDYRGFKTTAVYLAMYTHVNLFIYTRVNVYLYMYTHESETTSGLGQVRTRGQQILFVGGVDSGGVINLGK